MSKLTVNMSLFMCVRVVELVAKVNLGGLGNSF